MDCKKNCFFYRATEYMHTTFEFCDYYPIESLYESNCKCNGCDKHITRKDAINAVKKFVDER